jgi:small-conductance mechanosensitive channel
MMILESSQVLVSIAVIATAIGFKIASYFLLRSVTRNFSFKLARKAVISRLINLALFLTAGVILLGIWEVDPEDLFIYLASIFAVIGIAFFHQRSHLSNITAGVMLFFNHRAKVGDFVIIHDSDNTVEGKIEDIGLIFITILSNENDRIMISNTVFLQKTVSIKQLELSDRNDPAIVGDSAKY